MTASIQAIDTKSPARDPATTLIRINEVIAMVGLARPTIYKLMQRPDCNFPLPVKLSNSNARGAPVAWVLSEVQAWTRTCAIERADSVLTLLEDHFENESSRLANHVIAAVLWDVRGTLGLIKTLALHGDTTSTPAVQKGGAL